MDQNLHLEGQIMTNFTDAGEKSPEEREKILQDILSTIKEK